MSDDSRKRLWDRLWTIMTDTGERKWWVFFGGPADRPTYTLTRNARGNMTEIWAFDAETLAEARAAFEADLAAGDEAAIVAAQLLTLHALMGNAREER